METNNELQPKRTVSFSQIEVREYELGLSDNPACPPGPAVSLGWEYTLVSKEHINDYEKHRDPMREMGELILTRKQRELIMKNSKYSQSEIRSVTQSKAKIRAQRSQTFQNLPLSRYEEKLESAKRKMKRILLCQKKDAALKKLWPEYNKQMDKFRKSTDMMESSISSTGTSMSTTSFATI